MSSGTTRRVPAWLDTAAAVGWRLLVLVATLVVTVFALVNLSVVVIPVIGALWAVFLLAVALVVALGGGVAPPVAAQFGPLGRALNHSLESFQHWLASG